MCEVAWDGETLTARGTNKAAQVALAGIEAGQDVVIPKSEIVDVQFKNASAMVNGALSVTIARGRTYKLNFRKKQRDDFAALNDELQRVVA